MTILKIGLVVALMTVSVVRADLSKNAPSSKDLSGVHLLLDNDLDTATPKNPIILLSKPRTFNESQATCLSLEENIYDSKTSGDVLELLKTSNIVHNELKDVSYLWVDGHSNEGGNCTALDRQSSKTIQLPCDTEIPSLCTNSLPRITVVDRNTTQQIKVQTPESGIFQGYRDRDAFRFLGIPYAEPPVGSLRFKEPKRLPKSLNSETVVDSTEFGDVCTQFTGNLTANPAEDQILLGATQSENCLHLNVYTPSLKSSSIKGLPVMVYIHGGSFTGLSGSAPMFEPGNLVSRGGVVVVTLNYRLGIFGLFESASSIPRSEAPGNLSIRDQIAALQWIQDNIASFGGDPQQVTLFGESAGAWSIRILLTVPSSFGLYRNIISESDPMGLPSKPPSVPTSEVGASIMKALGCQSSDLSCAQNKTVEEIKKVELEVITNITKLPGNEWMGLEDYYCPSADGSWFPMDFDESLKSGQYNRRANILWGTNKDEMFLFTPDYLPEPVPISNASQALPHYIPGRAAPIINSTYYKFNTSDPDTVRIEFSTAFTDLEYNCPSQIMSRAATSKGSKVYTYMLNHGRSPYTSFGGELPALCANRVCHGDDIVPTFGSGDQVPGAVQTGDDARFSRQMIDRVSTFAWTGNPNPKKGLDIGFAFKNTDVTDSFWPQYNQQNPVMNIGLENSRPILNADITKCAWIEKNIKFEYQARKTR